MTTTKYPRGKTDKMIRMRIAAWLRKYQKLSGAESKRQFAAKLQVNHAYLSRVLNLRQDAGIELLVRAKQNLNGVSLDEWIMTDPEPEFFKPW